MSLYPPPQPLESEVFVDVVEQLGLVPRSSPWLARSGLPDSHSFLEGPVFDEVGNLYVVDAPFGRILRVDADRQVRIVAEYDGTPNGLAIGHDGNVYIADRENGILRFEPGTGSVTEVVSRSRLEPGFKGPNDLVFDTRGNLYFTDQGDTDLNDPTGRVFRLNTDGSLDRLLSNVPSPNGIALSPDETRLYVAVTFGQQVWHMPLRADGRIIKVGVFQNFSGGFSGPDGLAVDREGGLAVCQNRTGSVWLFDPLGVPTYRIKSCRGLLTTNATYGPDGRTLFITESETGSILKATVPA
ncbi:MAG TPA: SMP-30/gluconolactonase/LRE family protein [Devosia sp.]|nr:SMP-30/gluconolactonase/LRE family protein [Devosia sp.]